MDGEDNEVDSLVFYQVCDVLSGSKHPTAFNIQLLFGGVVVHKANNLVGAAWRSMLQAPGRRLPRIPRPHD